MLKKIMILSIVILFFGTTTSYSQLAIGVSAGLSTPNDEINNVYSKGQMETSEGIGKTWRDGSQSGYHIGLKIRMELAAGFLFHGGLGWHRFPETDLSVKDPDSDEILLSMSTYQDLIPITAGISFYPIKKIFDVYVTGEIAYNFLQNTVNIPKGDVAIPLNLDPDPADSRVGVGFGIGADLDLFLATANLEARYNIINMVGSDEDEDMKSYFSVGLTVYFGKP